MAKREFIDIDNALKAVDDRVEELRKDKQFRYSKQIDVNGVKNHFPDYPIIPEQDIVKPYLVAVKEEAEKLKKRDNCTFDRLIALDNVIQFIDNLLEE